jgi:acyl-ACP thioesterase
MEPLLKRNFEIFTWEADPHRLLRISSLFNYMQEAASNHADLLGVGPRQLGKEEKYWLLSRVHLVWTHLPDSGKTIRLHTWPKGQVKLFSIRDFRFFQDGKGEFARATSAWLLMDNSRKKLLRLDQIHPGFPLHPDSALDGLPPRLKMPESREEIYTRTARYSDIDFIGHVNNARYVEWAIDALPEPFIAALRTGGFFQIEYLAECLPGQSASISLAKDPENEAMLFLEADSKGSHNPLFRVKTGPN